MNLSIWIMFSRAYLLVNAVDLRKFCTNNVCIQCYNKVSVMGIHHRSCQRLLNKRSCCGVYLESRGMFQVTADCIEPFEGTLPKVTDESDEKLTGNKTRPCIMQFAEDESLVSVERTLHILIAGMCTLILAAIGIYHFVKFTDKRSMLSSGNSSLNIKRVASFCDAGEPVLATKFV